MKGADSGNAWNGCMAIELVRDLRESLAIIHDTNAWIHENQPDVWTRRVDEITEKAIDAADKFLNDEFINSIGHDR